MQSQSSSLMASHGKETLSSPHVCARPQGRAHTSWLTATGSWQSSRPKTATTVGGSLVEVGVAAEVATAFACASSSAATAWVMGMLDPPLRGNLTLQTLRSGGVLSR